MQKKNQHVVPGPEGGWGVKGSGNRKFTKLFDRKDQAIDFGREVSENQKSELFVHGKNGKIQTRDSHGNDPYPPKG